MKKWLAAVLADDPKMLERRQRARNSVTPESVAGTGYTVEDQIRRPRATGGVAARVAITEAPKVALEELCELVVEGGTLSDWCRNKGVTYTFALNWLKKDDARQAQYDAAREARADRLVDEIVAISDETPESVSISAKGSRSVGTDSAGVQRNALRVKTRQWYAEKLQPKRYAQRATVAHTGADGGPLQVANLSDAALEKIILRGSTDDAAQHA